MKNNPIENRIYASISLHCEELENNRAYRGNGHHLAQRLTSMVAVGLLPKQQKKIYDALLIGVGKKVKDISKETKIPSKTVSAQLIQMQSKTLLISFKKDGKNKLWFKYQIN